jgi:hypothetical protein
VKSIADTIGSRIYSERQGKIITLKTPKANQSLLAIKEALKETRRSTNKLPHREDLLDAIRTRRNIRGWRVKSKVQACDLRGAKASLKHVPTHVKTVTEVLGTDQVFSERQGKVITLKSPRIMQTCGASPSPTSSSYGGVWPHPSKWPTYAKACDLRCTRSNLKPATTQVKSLQQYLGTNQIFSERQGKIITICQPVAQQCKREQDKSEDLAIAAQRAMTALRPILKVNNNNNQNPELTAACEVSLAGFLTVLSQLLSRSTDDSASSGAIKDPAHQLLAKHGGDLKAAMQALMEASNSTF